MKVGSEFREQENVTQPLEAAQQHKERYIDNMRVI